MGLNAHDISVAKGLSLGNLNRLLRALPQSDTLRINCICYENQS